MPRVMEILSRELGIPYEDVTKRGEGTEYLGKKVMCMELTEASEYNKKVTPK